MLNIFASINFIVDFVRKFSSNSQVIFLAATGMNGLQSSWSTINAHTCQKMPDHFYDISLTKAFFQKYLQPSSKYVENLCYISNLFSKVS